MARRPDSQDNARKKRIRSEAKVEDRIRSLRDIARTKAAEVLRQSRGIDAPQKAPQEAAAPAPKEATPETAPAAPPPAASDELVKRLEARLQKQQGDAAARLAAAQKAQAEADAKMAELAAATKNPVEFLEKNGIDLDTWQARLLNGGEATKEEKAQQALLERVAKAEAAVKAFEEKQAQSQVQAQQNAAVDSLRKPLASDFPLVNRFMGAEAALNHLREKQSQSDTPIDAKAAIAELEKGFKDGLLQTVQDPAIASILNLSPSTPIPGKAAIQGPRTMTNSVTSSTAPSPSGRTTPEQKREMARKIIAQMRGG